MVFANAKRPHYRSVRSPSLIKFFKVSDIEQACDAGQANLRRDVAVGFAGGTERYAGCAHARISTGILSRYCCDRAASLSGVQPESHAALEA
jgi:hypothetical protein